MALFGWRLLSPKSYKTELVAVHATAWREGHAAGHKEAREIMTVIAKEIWAMAEVAGKEGCQRRHDDDE